MSIAASFGALPPIWAGATGLVLGAIIGSYLATLALRLPKGESATHGRSRCDGCERPLRWFELVPLFAYIAWRGKCRRCGARIDPVHPIMESCAAAIGALSLAVYPGLTGLAGALFGWVLLLLAILDIRHFWLPDRVTVPLVLLGIAAAWLLGSPKLLDAAIGAAAGFLLLYSVAAVYRAMRGREGLGGGDSKLLAAIGAWLGWQLLPIVILLASATGLLAVLAGAARGRAVAATDRLPFGAFLAVVAWPLWLAREPLKAIFPGL